MAERQWVLTRRSRRGGALALGERLAMLPEDAVVSITLGAGFSLWQFIINGLASQFVMKQCQAMPGLLYGELESDLSSGYSLTLTVWKGRDLSEFKSKKAHGWAVRMLWWVFYGGNAEAWFLTYKASHIPTAAEAKQLAEQYGRHFKQGAQVRGQTRPELA